MQSPIGKSYLAERFMNVVDWKGFNKVKLLAVPKAGTMQAGAGQASPSRPLPTHIP